MKKILTFALVLFIQFSFAQKAKVVTAWNHLKYSEFDKAQAAIDEAIANETSKDMAKTWYYRGLIYQGIFSSKDSAVKKLHSDPLTVAYDSYRKSLELDGKSEFVDDINARLKGVAMIKGIEDYKQKKYSEAVVTFEYLMTRFPKDTILFVYAAYASDYSKDFVKAKQYYNKLIEMNYRDEDPAKTNIYLDMARIYFSEKDTTKAMEYILMGRKRYPGVGNLIREELNIYLRSGRQKEALEKLDLAIAADPKDALLPFVKGTIYDNLANPKDVSGKDLPKPADFKDLMAKSEASYKKAIELKPDYFDAYYNLGALYFNRGAEMANEANKIPPKETAKYAAAEKDFKAKFEEARPNLEKALELNPNDRNTLLSLKQLYARIGMTEKSIEMKKRLEGK